MCTRRVFCLWKGLGGKGLSLKRVLREGSRCEGYRINVPFIYVKTLVLSVIFEKGRQKRVSQFLRPFGFARDFVCTGSVFYLWKGLGGKGLSGEGCSKAKTNMI